MSRNHNKITKALNAKGYYPIEITWEPIRSAPIMCGPEGGWYIKVGVMAIWLIWSISDMSRREAEISMIVAYIGFAISSLIHAIGLIAKRRK